MSSAPLVSILTPTYERHAFLPYLARMIARQTCDLSRVEWVVVDDSASTQQHVFAKWGGKLLQRLMRVHYVHLPHKVPIGCKRNLTTTLARGDYMMHMDDDDYYAPNYVDTVLQMFADAKDTPVMDTLRPQIVGATTICLMYPQSLWLEQSGPFHSRHTCGGAMSYTRKYARTHTFPNDASKCEEPAFLEGNPVAQIRGAHNIYMVFVHAKNTVPKDKVKRGKAKMRWLDVVQHADVLLFYLALHAEGIPWGDELPTSDELVAGTREAYGYAFYALTVLQALRRIVLRLMGRVQVLTGMETGTETITMATMAPLTL